LPEKRRISIYFIISIFTIIWIKRNIECRIEGFPILRRRRAFSWWDQRRIGGGASRS
jgi:hypothetical protein